MININIGSEGQINITQESAKERLDMQALSYERQKEQQLEMDRQINGGSPDELFRNGYGAGLGMVDVALQTGGIEDVYRVLAANIEGWTPSDGVYVDNPATQIVSDEDQPDRDGPNYQADYDESEFEDKALADVTKTEAWADLRKAFHADTDEELREALGEMMSVESVLEAERESELEGWASSDVPPIVAADPLITPVADSGEPDLEQSEAPIPSAGQWTMSAEELHSHEEAAFLRGVGEGRRREEARARDELEAYERANPERKFQNVTTRKTLERFIQEINESTEPGTDPVEAVVTLAKRLGYEVL